MAPESQQYTTFMVCNLGFYEFTRMPFGLCNTPATFQHLMQNTLGELNLIYCIIYLDDVIVYGHTEEEHLEHLWIVLEHFREFNLKLKPSKCSFFQTEIVYLTHHVSKEGIRPSSKLEFLMLKWSFTEHFKEYLAYAPFMVHMDNNPLTYVLTTPNLDATGHRWVGALASYEFNLEYQK